MSDAAAPAPAPTVIDPALDYNSQKLYKHGMTQFNIVTPNNLGGAVTISESLTPITMNLAPDVYNLRESFLSFQVVIPDAADVGAGPSPAFIWTHEDVLSEIQTIQFYPATSQNWLVNLDNVPIYSKVVIKHETSFKHMLCNDPDNTPYYPSNSAANDNPRCPTGAGVNPSNMSFLEPRYYERSAVAGAGSGRTYTVNLPLKYLHDTIFAMDQLWYFPQIMYFRVYWNQLSKIVFCTDSTIGVGNLLNNNQFPYAPAPAAANAPSINNIQLFLAVEQNPSIRAETMNRFNSGLRLIIPYPVSFKTTAAGGQQSSSVQLNSGYGKYLSRMYWTIAHPTDTLAQAYDINNIDGLKTINCYSMINNQREQLVNLSSVGNGLNNYTDYIQLKNGLEGSALFNRNIYQYNWHILSDYSDFSNEYVHEGKTDLVSGYPMGGVPIIWNFYGANMNVAGVPGNAYNHYGYGIFSKVLFVDTADVRVD